MRTRSFTPVCIVLMTLIAAIAAPNPASSTTIFQCAQKNNGLLRVVQAASDCLPSENSIVLNIPDAVPVPVVVHGSAFFPGGGNPPQVVANGSIGFSIQQPQPQPGQFVVVFDSAFDAVPTCQVTALNPPVNLVGYCTTITAASTTAVGVACRFFLSDGSSILRDQDFTLICIL
jgi:hypothetical protein